MEVVGSVDGRSGGGVEVLLTLIPGIQTIIPTILGADLWWKGLYYEFRSSVLRLPAWRCHKMEAHMPHCHRRRCPPFLDRVWEAAPPCCSLASQLLSGGCCFPIAVACTALIEFPQADRSAMAALNETAGDPLVSLSYC